MVDKVELRGVGFLWIFFGCVIGGPVRFGHLVYFGGRELPILHQNLSLGLWIAGAMMLAYGLSLYARSKGYSGWWGLSGLICIGLPIVLLMPDRLPEPAPTEPAENADRNAIDSD